MGCAGGGGGGGVGVCFVKGMHFSQSKMHVYLIMISDKPDYILLLCYLN